MLVGTDLIIPDEHTQELRPCMLETLEVLCETPAPDQIMVGVQRKWVSEW